MTHIDLTGRRFGRLLVLGIGERRYGKRAWRCRCSCGGENTYITGDLTSGAITSCGCRQRYNRPALISEPYDNSWSPEITANDLEELIR